MRAAGRGENQTGLVRLAAVGSFLFILILLLAPELSAALTLEASGQGTALSFGTPAPLAAVSSSAGRAPCVSTLSVRGPSVTTPAWDSVNVTEPRACPSRTTLTFLPGAEFTNSLVTAAGHLLVARLTIVALGGTFAILRNVRLYLQQVGGGNPIVTTSSTIRNGVIGNPQGSAATLSASTIYGVGLRMTLSHLATTSMAQVLVVVQFVLDDGGIPRSTFQERVFLTLTY